MTNIKLLEFIKNCKNNTEEWINTEDLKKIYTFLDECIEKKYYAFECEKAKKKIEKLDQNEPASLKYSDIVGILTDLKNNMKKNVLKYDSEFYFEDYKQSNKRIYKLTNKDDDEKNLLVSSLSFESLERIKDELDLFDPVFNITYWNGLDKELITKENLTKKELIKELQNSDCFKDKKEIEPVLNNLIIIGAAKEKVKISKKVFKKGFYLKDGKVIENSDIKDKKFTPKEIKKGFLLLNEILNQRGEQADHDASVLRFMLHAPFHWCIKELGKANHNIKYYELFGKQGSNKTGAVKIGYWFYFNNPTNIEDTVDTVAAFGRQLQKSTFPILCDDSYNLLTKQDMDQTLKSSTHGKYSRSVSDTETENNKHYYALSTPVFTHNEDHIISDGNIRRSMPLYYDETYIINEDKAKEFIEKYNPENANSLLIELNPVGYAIKEKMIQLIEEDNPKLVNIEKVTTEILENIANELDIELNPYLLMEPVRSTDLDEDLDQILINGMIKLFRKEVKLPYNVNGYNKSMVINAVENRSFDWLYYQPNNKCFVIRTGAFRKSCKQLIGQQLSINELLKVWEIHIPSTEFNKTIHIKHESFKGFKIQWQELKKIFNVYYLENEEDLDNYY